MKQLIVSNWLKQTQKWLVTYVVQEIPSHLSVCEFDCNETQCNQQKWLNCCQRYQ